MGCASVCNNGSSKPTTQIIINESSKYYLAEDKPLIETPGKKYSSSISHLSFIIPNKSFSTAFGGESKSLSDISISKEISDFFPTTIMLKEINLARTDPLSYAKKIENLKEKIVTVVNNIYLDVGISLKLFKGAERFDNCVNYLKALSKKRKLEPLRMNEQLKVPFPIQTPLLCIDKDYIKNIILFKIEELKGKIRFIDFHYDICISNPELSTMMQIIDDTNSNFQRRNNIFNPRAKTVGITEGIIRQNMSCYYLMFAE